MADYTYNGLSVYANNKSFIEELHVLEFLLPSMGARDFLGENFNADLIENIEDVVDSIVENENNHGEQLNYNPQLALSEKIQNVLASEASQYIQVEESAYYLNHEENLPSNTPREYQSLSISVKSEKLYIYAAVALKHGADTAIDHVQKLIQDLFGEEIQQIATIELMEYEDFADVTPQVVYKKN